MAVSNFWPVRYNLGQVINYAANPEKTDADTYSQEQYQALADVLAYAKNEEKTEKQFYVQGINCDPEIARTQFINVKKRFNKTEGIQAYHGYLSFRENEVTPAQCQAIGMEFAQRVWGDNYQVVVTTHLNTKHLHCHFVVNSVSFVNGLMLHDEEKAWFKFKEIADEICQAHGLSVVKDPKRNRDPYYLVKKNEEGGPTRYNILKEVIDQAISMSRNMHEFRAFLDNMGYSYNLSSNRKYWTVTPKGSKKPIRLYRLGDDYTNDRIMERIRDNPETVRDNQVRFWKFSDKQYGFRTRADKLKKKDGLRNLYLYYCYKLGYLPKYRKNRSSYRLHYLLKEDLTKIDMISAEARLLGKYSIENAEQLFDRKDTLIIEIDLLEKERRNLYRQEKTNVSVSRNLASVNDSLKEKRKDVKLIDDIAVRSDLIEQNIETIDEKERREKEKNELFR